MRVARQASAAVATIALLGLVACIEAARLGEVVLAILCGASVAVALVLLGLLRQRPLTGLRADLAAWAEQSGALTGEAPEHLVNRAVSDYRARLGAPPGAGNG